MDAQLAGNLHDPPNCVQGTPTSTPLKLSDLIADFNELSLPTLPVTGRHPIVALLEAATDFLGRTKLHRKAK